MPDHTAADYRGMAERALAQAAEAKDATIKASLLEIASRYAWMADWVERSAGAAGAIPAAGHKRASD